MTLSPPSDNPASRGFLWRTVKIERGEAAATFAAFGYLFCLFTAYSLLRPVRETMGITSGVAKLPALFWGTFVGMLAVQPIYGWIASRYRRRQFLPWVYAFFTVNLLGFYAWFSLASDHTWIARAFFIWLSIFNLFVVSVFWSFMVDIFREDQAKRLFAFIAAGASLGGILGPSLAAILAPRIGTINLLLISAVFLVTTIAFILYLSRWQARLGEGGGRTAAEAAAVFERPIGGSPWGGFTLVAKSPYLLGIAGFVFLLTWVSTFLYLQQADLVSRLFTTPDEQTRVFGLVDLAVQALSLAAQLLLVGRLTSRFGLTVMLVAVPVLMVAGFVLLGVRPVLPVLLGVMIVRRVGEYAVSRPCREMLFTTVDRQTKYKAKNFIDTVIYRGGDALSGSAHALLLWLGLAASGIAWAGAVVALAWAAVAYAIGRAQARGAGPAQV